MFPISRWFDVRNTLVMAERRAQLTQNDVDMFLRFLPQLRISMDRAPDEARIIALARRHRLTVYDAAYLDLAMRECVALATLDQALVCAARQEGVALVGVN